MAARDHVLINKDFFHCSICLEQYQSPRSLPCLHSFCHICLHGYIQKVLDKPGKQNLLCPICRADTKTDNDTFNSVEKWVRSFPINFNLLSILNDAELKMNTSVNFCEPCIREENKIIATAFCYECSETLCEECRRHHMKIKSSSNHKLIEIGEKSSLDLKELEYLAHLSKCPKHCSEEVRYLCQDHDQLCCNECAIVTHRKCENMVSLADEAQKKEDEINISKKLEDIEKEATKLIKHESAFTLGLDTKEEEVKCHLKRFKTEIDQAYAQLENTVLSKMSEKRMQLTKQSTFNAECAEKLKNDVKCSAAKVTKTCELGTATHIFLLEREIEKNVKHYEERLNNLQLLTSKTSWVLTESRLTKDTSEAICNSFQIQDEKEKLGKPGLPSAPVKTDFRKMNLTQVNDFTIQEKSQPRYCLWIGSCIVVAFELISKINVYSDKDGSLLSSYQRASRPAALAEIENSRIAVALPESHKIDIFKLDKNQLSYVKLLAHSDSTLLAYDKSHRHLYAMTRSSRTIIKFNLDGKEAGRITLDFTYEAIIAAAYIITFDAVFSRLYISSHHAHILLCVDMSGKIMFQYSNKKLRYPWSVIIDMKGNIYVTSYGGHLVQKLSKEGQLLNTSEKNAVRSPLGLSFNSSMDKLIVTSQGNIRMFQFD